MNNETQTNQPQPNQGAIDSASLVSFIERAETVKAQIADLQGDLKQIFGEAKDAGYEPKYIKLLIKIRAMDPDELDENDELTKMYRSALGL